MARHQASIRFWWDGCCEPVNPGGHATYGVFVEQNRKQILAESKYVGHGPKMSNNVAEYSGFVRALEFLLDKGLQNRKIVGRGDSKLVIEQVQGNWRVNGGLYYPYYLRAVELFPQFTKLTLVWVPRDQNEKADELSKAVLKERNITLRIQPEE